MEQKEDTKNIFVEEIEDSIPIVFAILACIHPIEVFTYLFHLLSILLPF